MRPRTDLDAAFARTDAEHYQRTADGSRYVQSTRPAVVRAVLRLLDLPRGATVLEIGTGSGFATGVLSRAVGPAGCVHSVDVDPEVTVRAAGLLAADGRANVRVRTADALRTPLDGDLDGDGDGDGPVDRLVAFLSVASVVPPHWSAAVRPGGLLVVPLRERGRVVRFRRSPVDDLLHEEGGVDATF